MLPSLQDDGRLLVSRRAEVDDGTIGDALVAIDRDDPEFERWLPFLRDSDRERLEAIERTRLPRT